MCLLRALIATTHPDPLTCLPFELLHDGAEELDDLVLLTPREARDLVEEFLHLADGPCAPRDGGRRRS